MGEIGRDKGVIGWYQTNSKHSQKSLFAVFLRCSKLTPLGKGGGSVGFEMFALRKVAIEIEMVADIGMAGGKFLQVDLG
ncbi:hypothetical protein [Paracoccus albus]|uniref:hypothetical protein n=1 Tax=Paracoccus albus TaxID=3017784 RepID=UPI003EBBB3C8